MTKISDKSLANIQAGDNIPIDRSGADYRVQPDSFKSYLLGEGMLVGDSTAIYAENTSDNATWQLGQKAASISTSGSSPVEGTVDCGENDVFAIAPSAVEIEIQSPTNVPSLAQLGGTPAAAFYFRIYARNASSGSAGFVSFSSDWTKLPGSKEYLRTGTDRLNIIHCWVGGDGELYYKIDNSSTSGGVVNEISGTITSAEILNSNTSPVELIAAPGAGKFIEVDGITSMNETGTNYATNTNAYFRHDGQGSSYGYSGSINSNGYCQMNALVIADLTTSTLENKAFIFETNTGDPTAGTFDIYYTIKYRILDYPF